MGTAVRKITLDGVCGKTPKVKEGESIHLMRVYGVVTGFNVKNNQFGPYTTFGGDFEAVNIQTGAVVESAALILPDADAAEQLSAAFNREVNREGGSSGVTFALDVLVTYSKKSSTGYAYMAKPVRKASAHDALADLRNDLPKLPAPKKS